MSLSIIEREQTISTKPSREGPYYVGTALNLTCDIDLDPAIDVPVVRSVQWDLGGGRVFNTPREMGRITLTETYLEFSPLNITDSMTYWCNVQFKTECCHRFGKNFTLNVTGKTVITF